MNGQNTVNKVFLLGHISKTPRWHKTEGEDAVLSFTLITKETHRLQNSLVEHTEEHVIKLPGKRVETELKLGQVVHIEGRLKTSVSVDEQQIRRYKTEVIALRVTVV